MKKVRNGFAFTAVSTSMGLGVKEEYRVLPQKEGIKVEAVFGLDLSRKPCKPAVIRQDRFVPVADLVVSCLDMQQAFQKFIRSNKPVYSVLQAMVLLCKVAVWYDWNDRHIINSTISLYTPKTIGTNGSETYIVFSQVATHKGIDCVQITEVAYNAFRDSTLEFMQSCIADRSDFLKNRLGINFDEEMGTEVNTESVETMQKWVDECSEYSMSALDIDTGKEESEQSTESEQLNEQEQVNQSIGVSENASDKVSAVCEINEVCKDNAVSTDTDENVEGTGSVMTEVDATMEKGIDVESNIVSSIEGNGIEENTSVISEADIVDNSDTEIEESVPTEEHIQKDSVETKEFIENEDEIEITADDLVVKLSSEGIVNALSKGADTDDMEVTSEQISTSVKSVQEETPLSSVEHSDISSSATVDSSDEDIFGFDNDGFGF